MNSYFFILSGSFFVKLTNIPGGQDCKCARKIFFNLRRMSKIKENIKVYVVYETDSDLRKEAQKGKQIYNFLRSFYNVAKSYSGDEENEIINLAKDKAKIYDYVIIVNGSNTYEGRFTEKEKENIFVKSEIDTWNYIINELSL